MGHFRRREQLQGAAIGLDGLAVIGIRAKGIVVGCYCRRLDFCGLLKRQQHAKRRRGSPRTFAHYRGPGQRSGPGACCSARHHAGDDHRGGQSKTVQAGTMGSVRSSGRLDGGGLD